MNPKRCFGAISNCRIYEDYTNCRYVVVGPQNRPCQWRFENCKGALSGANETLSRTFCISGRFQIESLRLQIVADFGSPISDFTRTPSSRLPRRCYSQSLVNTGRIISLNRLIGRNTPSVAGGPPSARHPDNGDLHCLGLFRDNGSFRRLNLREKIPAPRRTRIASAKYRSLNPMMRAATRDIGFDLHHWLIP